MSKNKNKFDWLSADFNQESSSETPPVEPEEMSEKGSVRAVHEPVPFPVHEAKAPSLSLTPQEVQVSEPAKPPRRDGKRSNPDYKVVGVQLSVLLHRKAKELLLKKGEEKNFSDLINELLEDWVNHEER